MSTLAVRKQVPAAPTAIAANSSTKLVNITWDPVLPITNKYEVWRNTTDNTTGGASKIAEVDTNSYADNTLTYGQYAYYWVKTKNTAGTVSGFGTAAPSALLGSVFNTLTLRVWDNASGTVTTSIDNVKARVWYTPSGGSPTDTGLIVFTTAVTNGGPGTNAWTNPANARVDDTSYATVTSTGAQDSQDLIFTLNDLGVPGTATITGFAVQIDGKSTDKTRTNINAYITNSTQTYDYGSYHFTDFANNNTDEQILYGANGTLWDFSPVYPAFGLPTAAVTTGEIVSDYFSPTTVKMLNGGSYANLTAYNNGASSGSTSASGSNTTAYGLSGVTAVTGGSSTTTDIMTSTSSRYGNVPGYGTWYIVAQSGYIELDGTFSAIPIIIEAFTQWTFSNVVVTSSNTCEVKIRFRLRNTTDSTEVTREFTLFKQTGTQLYACQPNFNYTPNIMYPDLSTTKMSLSQNKAYTLFLEVQKNRSSTDTVDARCTTAFLNFSFGR